MSFKIIKQKKQQQDLENIQEINESLVRILFNDHRSFYERRVGVAIDNIYEEENTSAGLEKQTDLNENFFEDIFQKDEVKNFKKIIAEELDGIITDNNQKKDSKPEPAEENQPKVVDRRKRR